MNGCNVAGDTSGSKHVDPRFENKRFCSPDERRSYSPFQELGFFLPCYDRGSFNTDSFDQKEEISHSCPTRFNQLIFSDLSNHMPGENHPVHSRSDLRVASDKGDFESMTGVVDLTEDFIDEPLIRSFLWEE